MYRVYVVDDDDLILSEIVEAVPWLDNGFTVCGWSRQPFTAADEIAALRPDVVFTDLKMPGMDGLGLIEEVRRRGVDCEFVMLSAYSTFPESRAFFLLSGFDYILKPLQQNDIQLVLERLYQKLLQKGPPREPDWEELGVNPAFLRLVGYVREHFREKLSLKKLAAQFDINPNYICNLFAKHHGTTLTRFVTDLRMKEAGRQIRGTGKPFKVIAIDVGYSDYYYFCKGFREYFGMAPSAYRGGGGEEGPGDAST